MPIFCGDFNINMLDKSSTTNSFEEILSLCNLHMLFDKPTRICDTTATLIDNVIVDRETKSVVESTCNIDIVKLSDHKAQFVYIKKK